MFTPNKKFACTIGKVILQAPAFAIYFKQRVEILTTSWDDHLHHPKLRLLADSPPIFVACVHHGLSGTGVPIFFLHVPYVFNFPFLFSQHVSYYIYIYRYFPDIFPTCSILFLDINGRWPARCCPPSYVCRFSPLSMLTHIYIYYTYIYHKPCLS